MSYEMPIRNRMHWTLLAVTVFLMPGLIPAADQSGSGPTTLHYRHVTIKRFGSGKDLKQRVRTTEEWLELQTGRSYTQHWLKEDGEKDQTRLTNEDACDGQDYVLVYHDDRQAAFGKIHPLMQELERRFYQGELLKMLFVADPRHNKRFTRVGQDTLLGAAHDIWHGIVPRLNKPGDWMVRAWLRADTGELGRLEVREDSGEPGLLHQSYEVLERNTPFPSDRIKLVPPTGFAVEENAGQQVYAWGGFGYDIRVQICFAFADGSLLMAWNPRSVDKAEQKEKVERLKTGDPLPEFRGTEVSNVRTVGLEQEIEYVGRHLTYTVGGPAPFDGYWQWSLYVPRTQPPERSRFFSYAIATRPGPMPTNVKAAPWHWNQVTDLPIADAAEYNRFVLPAMQEYATKQPDRQFPSYEEVLQLAEKTRQSLKASEKESRAGGTGRSL